MTGETGSEWKTLSTNPEVRLRAIREYAANVLGSHAGAEAWLHRSDITVRGGSCTVLAACETPVGFYEAMAELARIAQFKQREARKRARLRERDAAAEPRNGKPFEPPPPRPETGAGDGLNT